MLATRSQLRLSQRDVSAPMWLQPTVTATVGGAAFTGFTTTTSRMAIYGGVATYIGYLTLSASAASGVWKFTLGNADIALLPESKQWEFGTVLFVPSNDPSMVAATRISYSFSSTTPGEISPANNAAAPALASGNLITLRGSWGL